MTGWVRALGVVGAVALSVALAESLRLPAAAAAERTVAQPSASSGWSTSVPAQPDCATPTPRPIRHRPRPRVPATPGVTAGAAAAIVAPSPVPSATPSAVAAALPAPSAPSSPASTAAIAEAPAPGLVAPAVAPVHQPISASVALAGLVVLAALLVLIFSDRLVGSQRRPPNP